MNELLVRFGGVFAILFLLLLSKFLDKVKVCMNDQYIPQPAKQVDLQQVGNEGILLDHRIGKAHVLNASAVRIWHLCNGQNSLADICGEFAGLYDLPADRVADDVYEIVLLFQDLAVLE